MCGKVSVPGPLPALLTVNEHDLDHGDDEEGQGIHGHLHQGSGDQEHQQDGQQAAQDPDSLGDPEGEAEVAERRGGGRGAARGQAGPARSPPMQEGVEAGKEQQGQHGTQGHDIVEDGTQVAPLQRGCCGGDRRLDVPVQFGGDRGHVLGLVQAFGEILWGTQRGAAASLPEPTSTDPGRTCPAGTPPGVLPVLPVSPGWPS